MDWCLYGEDKRREIDRDLKPEYLLDDLRRYQDVFGEEFGVKELLMLEDIRVKAVSYTHLMWMAIHREPKILHSKQISYRQLRLSLIHISVET